MPRNVYIYDPNIPVPKKVRHVKIPEGIAVIKSEAFCGCSRLKSIVIPDSVTEIGNYAFKNCFALQSVTIPGSVTKIGSRAFQSCGLLQSITIPDSVTKIGEGAFEYSGLRSITIPDSVTEVGDCAFYHCPGLQSVTIPDSVTKIGESAFWDCSGLRSITIPGSVTEIGSYAFKDCFILQSVTIPDGVTEIGDNAFSNCYSLQSIAIPNSVTRIGNRAFQSCHLLQSVTIPDSVTKISDSTFCGCSALRSVTIPDSVTKIDSSAFDDCVALQSITIPDSVTEIGDYAFRDCSDLQSVTIPDSVTKIGFGIFEGCSGLQSVTIPESITEINAAVFHDCSGLQSVIIPDSVTAIRSDAFSHCSGLRSVRIPDSVTEIGKNAFYGCSGLSSVIIPHSVTEIGYGAFWECSALQSVTIPDSVTEISNGVFEDCSNLQSIVIPDSVTKIDCSAFRGCSGLQSIVIPDSVTEIGKNVFRNCSRLQSVTIPDSVTKIGANAFMDCTRLQTVTIPDSGAIIGDKAFHRCLALQSLMYNGTNIAPFINIDGHGVNTFDVIKKLVDRQIPLREDIVMQGICMQHRGGLDQWAQEYPIFGNMRFPAAMKRVSKKGKEQLRKCFAAQKKTKGRVPEILDELAITVRIFKIPSERLAETFDVEYTRHLLGEKIPIVPAEACRCYYSRDICNMLIQKGRISVMAEAIGLYNKSERQECYRHLMDFIRSHPDTKTEDLQYAVDHATEIPIGAKTTLAQIRRHQAYTESLTEVRKIEKKYGKAVSGFRLSDYRCNLNPTGITYDGMTARVLDLSDARDIALAARLGELTGCCQRLNEAGETAMMHGFLNPDAGFWVIEDANGTVKAQAEVWEAGPKNLVFDNIEFANTDNRHTADRAEQLRGVIVAWAMASGYENIIMGCGYNELGVGSMKRAPIPELRLTPEEVFALQKDNDAGVSFETIDEVRRYMRTEEYDPSDFVYSDADRQCVYIKKDGTVSKYLAEGYDRNLADKCSTPGHEAVKEQDDEIVCK